MNGYPNFIVVLITLLSMLQFQPVASSFKDSVHCKTSQVCVNSTHHVFPCNSKKLICCPDSLRPDREYQIHRVERPSDYKCCPHSKGKIYDWRAEACVLGRVVKRDGGRMYCGREQFNPREEVCCRNKTVARKYKIQQNGRCCNEKLITSPEEDCCGGSVYSKLYKTCCQVGEEFRLFDIRNGGCCSTRAYDVITHKCTFDGRVVENRGGESCAGIAYNSTTSMCCNHQVVRRREYVCERERSGRVVAVRKSHSQHDRGCNVHNLGWITYDSKDESKVCNPAGFHHLMAGERLCGYTRKINVTSDLCCGGHSPGYVKMGVAKGLKCCKDGSRSYDPIKETCCPTDRVHDIPEEKGRCCRNMGYDSTTHTCVEGYKIVPHHYNNFVEVKKQLEKAGAYIYFGTAVKKTKRKKKADQWRMRDAKGVTSKKKSSKISITGVGNKGALKAEVPRSFSMQAGKRYLFVVSKEVKRKRKNAKLVATQSGDQIINIDNMNLLALADSGLFS